MGGERGRLGRDVNLLYHLLIGRGKDIKIFANILTHKTRKSRPKNYDQLVV